ncbi:benzoyl-CoA-dihydrodiol lyase [Streptomyces sp. A7024]|uniref:Benzoyl-CoA-dihydrodiol lyase n=2 Tax=Streptomyces coryli TaxID=1128680 RepID=A0A6G4TXJ4_9ACTN|nr:benzoyl-CoA-dihydrodiol lyase [Streptomyces coryli]
MEVSFDTHPDRYRHWKLTVDGEVAHLVMDVAEDGGLVPGYELKLNSYDLGVDIELYDAAQRLRFEHPGVRAVVVTGGKDKIFSAGANIRMLAQSPHEWKVNFCKFTNETRCGIEDATEHSGQRWIAALNGTASGGGYEIALACDAILLVDDRSSAVSLPELPLLGVLPGTGGLTRVVDKRGVRRDLADYFATKTEGVRGPRAVEWGLVDESVPRRDFDAAIERHAAQAVAESARHADGPGVELTPLRRESSATGLSYDHVRATYDRDRRLVEITVAGPDAPAPTEPADAVAQGAGYWPLAVTRELDDLVLRLRTNEPELGTWLFRTTGDTARVLDHDAFLTAHAEHWFLNEVRHYAKRTLKRLDASSRSLIAAVEPGSAFAGLLLELALACDRQYMLDGVFEDADEPGEPAELVLTEANLGAYPMANGLSRLRNRFCGKPAPGEETLGKPLDAAAAAELGLVTFTPDDIDWDDELRLALEERAAFSPDALTGMEANYRFAGPETLETKIFGRLTAWQNWIFTRPNASGPEGALRRYGTGQRAVFDRKRV